jgi:hypothetical protein
MVPLSGPKKSNTHCIYSSSSWMMKNVFRPLTLGPSDDLTCFVLFAYCIWPQNNSHQAMTFLHRSQTPAPAPLLLLLPGPVQPTSFKIIQPTNSCTTTSTSSSTSVHVPAPEPINLPASYITISPTNSCTTPAQEYTYQLKDKFTYHCLNNFTYQLLLHNYA